MIALNIKGTNKSPSVTCVAENGFIEISGMSYAEDAFAFYEPIFNWLNDYLKIIAPVTEFNMKVKYFNTSSVKCIFDIMEVLSTWSKQGHKVKINWYYDSEDEEMKDTGENFGNILGLPVSLVEEVS